MLQIFVPVCVPLPVYHGHVLGGRKSSVNDGGNSNEAFLFSSSVLDSDKITSHIGTSVLYCAQPHAHLCSHTDTRCTWEDIVFFPDNVTGVGQ